MDHCVRKQKNKDLPTGVPQRIFIFSEKYGSENYNLHITEEQLVDLQWNVIYLVALMII